MKRLLVLRHAKSEYQFGVEDHDRGLNSRGRNDGKIMGNWLKDNINKPELIICSTATRTRMTLDIIIGETEWDSKVEYTKRLYLPSVKDVIQVLKNRPEKLSSILIVGHNFGFTDLINYFSYVSLDNLPTCGFAEFKIDKVWSKLDGNKFDLAFFKTPKELK